MMRSRALLAGVAAIVVLVAARPVAAQQPAPPVPQGAAQSDAAAISAGQIQRWFEAFTVLQAQDALGLSEAQYGRFVTRLKLLQEAQRKHQQARMQILNDLRRLSNPQNGTSDESLLGSRLKDLRDENDRGAAEIRKAYDAVDEVLDVRQQARFRLFEERMEQQKLELLMRARQNARNAARGRNQ
jgi:hypothetical protein